jgi:hypothetical protein
MTNTIAIIINSPSLFGCVSSQEETPLEAQKQRHISQNSQNRQFFVSIWGETSIEHGNRATSAKAKSKNGKSLS